MFGSVSLKGVRAFEAVARLGSFKAAASELSLTPSAVSHAVASLEKSMDVRLLDRRRRALRLTKRGMQFQRHVSLAFEQLKLGLEETSGRAPKLIRIHSAPSFAAAWLTPRLSMFLSDHPGIQVRLSASDDYCDFLTNEFDADIAYGPVRANNVEIIPITTETVAPMCAPQFASKIESSRDLQKFPLIQSENKLVGWDEWFNDNSIKTRASNSMRFDRSFLAISAASEGLGIALESTLLAEKELQTGRLVMPLSGASNDIHYVGHHLVFPKSGTKTALVRTFADWLTFEIEKSTQATPSNR